MMSGKAAGATGAAEGGGDAGAEAKVEAATEGGEAGELGTGGGVNGPVKVGEAADGGLLGEGPEEDSRVGVDGAGGGADEGGEETVLLDVEGKVPGVLAALGVGQGVGFEGAPEGGIAGLATEGVGDGHVSNDGGAVAEEELDVGVLVGVGVEREVGPREGRRGVGPADAGVGRDLGPDVEDVFVGGMPGARGVEGAGLGMVSGGVVGGATRAANVGGSRGGGGGRGEAEGVAGPNLPFREGETAVGAAVELVEPGRGDQRGRLQGGEG